MRIYNATKSTMNLPMANGSRLIIRPQECSRQFYPTTELLSLLVSAYTYNDIAIIIDSAAEISMGATVSALPGFVVNSVEDAIMKFKKTESVKSVAKTEAQSAQPQQIKKVETPKSAEVKPVVVNKPVEQPQANKPASTTTVAATEVKKN